MTGYRFATIGFLSDFGLADEFVGVCHGVLRRTAPEATVVDITHGVPAHDVAAGALLLAQAVPYFPEALHLAVVDPGVGSARRGIVIETVSGSCLVGPDNGLLIPAARALGGAVTCVGLPDDPDASRTFQGRDIFAPVAGLLATGAPLVHVGDRVPLDDLVVLALPSAVVGEGMVSGEVVQIDRFGNVATSITPTLLAEAGIRPGDAVAVTVGNRRVEMPYAVMYLGVGVGEFLMLVDSHALMAVCRNQASAAAALGAGRGARVTVATTSAAARG